LLLNWDPNTATDLARDKIFYEQNPTAYTETINVDLTNTLSTPKYIVNNLSSETTCYFSIPAYDTSGNKSALPPPVAKIFNLGCKENQCYEKC